jgi:PAS domain-containing protein
MATTTPEVTKFEADRFMNALANDLIASRTGTGGSAAPLQGIISDLLKNPAGVVQMDTASREAAATKLIESFGKLGGRPLPAAMQTMIKDVFTDASLTSAEDMARKIREGNFTAEFIQLIADNKMDFGNLYDGTTMLMLRAMFPDLANFIDDLGFGGGDPFQTATERRLEDSLAEGWDAWRNGKVHEFNEVRSVDANGAPVPLRNWTAPRTEHDINEFFESGGPTTHSQGLWGSDENYKFTDADPAARPNTFAGIIVQKWKDDGIVTFADAAAEEAFVNRSHALAVGGQLDGTFADTLVNNEVIQFASPADRQAFLDHMTAWRSEPGGQYRDAQEIMNEVISYVNENGGTSWVNPKFDDETASRYSKTQSDVYRVAKQYAIAESGEAYAEQMMRFAEEHPGVTLTAPAPPPAGGPSAAAADPNRPPPPADPNEIKVARFDGNEASGYLDYGNAITGDFDATTMAFKANDGTEIFKFSEDFQVYGVSVANGAGGGHTLTMEAKDLNGRTPQEILASLGDDFKVSVVAHQDADADVGNSELLGFYVESADGKTSFYIGPSAVEEGTMTAAGKAELIKGIEETPGMDRSDPNYDPSRDQNNTASIATNADATVDGQTDNTTAFQP